MLINLSLSDRFRERYHPRVKAEHEVELRRQRRERLAAFVDMLQTGHLDGVVLETDKADLVLRMMDAGRHYVMKLCEPCWMKDV